MGYDGDRFVWENRHARSTNACIGEVIYQSGGTCGPRVQQDFELVFLHSGELTVEVDGQAHGLATGCVARFLPGYREHFRFSRRRQTHHSWCTASPALVPADLRRGLEQAPFSVPCSEVLSRLLASGLALGPVHSAGAGRTVDCIVLSLLAGFVHCAEEQTGDGGQDVVVRKATRFLIAHLAEQDCLQRAHEAAGVSRNTLINRFRRELKTSPGRYLWRLRTERGIEMLTETGHTIAEIAYACGFQNPFHFSRLVRQLQGMSPQAIRRQRWATER